MTPRPFYQFYHLSKLTALTLFLYALVRRREYSKFDSAELGREEDYYAYKSVEFFKHDYRDSELKKCDATRPISKPSSSVSSSSPVSVPAQLEICTEPCADVANISGSFVDFQRTTVRGKDTVEVVQDILRYTWKQWDKRARPIDLFVRSGCRDAAEIRFLFDSVEIFWPRGIGHIIVVLDEGDAAIAAKSILPPQTKHEYRVFYERHPCMPGRIFNQISYLMADHYSSADTIVTVDSDVIFHSPVTPDLLFNEKGNILLAWSAKFQQELWSREVEFFTGSATYVGHSMISQPVTVHRSTLIAYRQWYASMNGGSCLLDSVVDFVNSNSRELRKDQYCWMCQINTFLQTTGLTADCYELIDVESFSSRPYRRFAVHVNYESLSGVVMPVRNEFARTVNAGIQQGLCLALGPRVLESCKGLDTFYIKQHLFMYIDWFWKLDDSQKNLTETNYVKSLLEGLIATGNR